HGRRADGETFPAETSISETLVGGRKFFTIILRDVSERLRAEEALRHSEERYRLLFESNPQPMWVYDIKTLAFLAVNGAAVRHYGYTPEEFSRMTIVDIRPEEDLARLQGHLKNLDAAMGGAVAWRHRKKDGSVIDVEIISHGLNFDGRA